MRTLVLYFVLVSFVLSSASKDDSDDTSTPVGKTVTPYDEEVLDDSTSLIFSNENDDTGTHETFPDTSTPPFQDESETDATPSLTPTQESVLNELRDIWEYSLSLDDNTDKELKTTLSNVVQLAYARVQIEPDETLDRLKYLLEKLRQRIGVSGTATSATTLNQTSTTDPPTINTGREPDDKNQTNPDLLSRRIRSYYGLGTGIGEVEAVPTSEENSIFSTYPHTNANKVVKNSYLYQNPVPTVTPNETTVHKILVVQDRVTIPVISNEKTTERADPGETTAAPPTLATLPPTMFYPSLEESFAQYQKRKPVPKPDNVNSSNSSQDSVSVDTIAGEIVKLLYPSPNDPQVIVDSTSGNGISKPAKPEFTFPGDKFLFEQKLALLRPNPGLLNQYVATTTKPGLYATYLQAHPLPSLNPEGNVTTTALQPVLLNLIANLKNQSSFIQNYFNQDPSDAALGEEVTEGAAEKIGGATTEGNDASAVSSSNNTSPPSTIALHIMDELQQSNIFQGPGAFLNGTREGLIQFIAALSTLSFTTKLVLVFALSISILSIVLGVYSLGPPIIAVGILGIMIPIAILLLLQDSSRNNSTNGNSQAKVTFNDQMSLIIDLIDKAVDKYGN